ncbi:YveK family protein [Psychrobacillus sp. FSL K6-1464]|uniref:YveK family protein n=1 Tax=Psychrobacillus sp. FSL K6-1464 TaxID=2921545 RepID=UPI0030F65920
MQEAINLQEVFKIIKKRFALIITILVLSMTIAGTVSYYYLTPIFQASTQILINQKEFDQNQFSSQDINTNLQLINTYNVIIKSPVILSKVIDNLNLKTTPELLNQQIIVSSEQNSQIVNVRVEDPDLQEAVDIANMTAKVFQEEIIALMNVDNVSILSPAVFTKDTLPIKPNLILSVGIAAVIGLMIGIGITFLMEYLDTSIKNEQDIGELLGLPILGLISPISNKYLKKTKEPKSLHRKRAKNLV